MHIFSKSRRAVSCMLLVAWICLLGCSAGRHMQAGNDKVLVSESSREGLQFKVFLLPLTDKVGQDSRQTLMLSIMIINTRDNTSPLKSRCSSLEDYNTYYEYLLNRCKDHLSLVHKGEIVYPAYYSFENNYNSFPFETINVGYRFRKGLHPDKHTQLVFDDQIFSHEILRFSLNKI